MCDISNIDLSIEKLLGLRMTEQDTVDLDTHIPALLFELGSKISLHAQRENARELGLDMCEWRTLQILGRDGASTINQIADRISMDRGGTSRAVQRLESRRILRRDTAKDDRRKSLVDLTPTGADLHRQVARFAIERERRLTRNITESDKQFLVQLLKEITKEVDDMLETNWRPETAPFTAIGQPD